MKKVLIAVDGTNDSKAILSVFRNLVRPPEKIVLLHVNQLEGNSMMIDMLSDSEVETLKESVKGTEHLDKLNRRAERILTHYKKELEHGGLISIKTVVRDGRPADEILSVAEEEGADLIVVGCSGKSRLQKLVTGCASRDIEKNAKVPVLVAKGNGCGDHAHVWRESYAVQ
ncbi:MAG: universal stress protein [Nitrospirota bacterium]